MGIHIQQSKAGTAVVRPAMAYGASVWYSPKETRVKCLGPAAKLITLHRKCLRSITEAYKATNVKVLEAEAGVMPLDMYQDQTVLQSRNASRCAEVISHAKETIRKKLRGKKGRRRQAGATPIAVKNAWIKSSMKKSSASRR